MELISRQAAIDALRTCYDTETITMDNGDEYINYGDAVGEIEQLTPAEPERLKGEWEIKKATIHPYGNDVCCSICGHTMGSTFGYKFCPMCGADMRGEQNESN